MPAFPTLSDRTQSVPSSVYSGLVAQFGRIEGDRYPLHIGDTWLEPPPGCEPAALVEDPEINRYTPVPGLPELREALRARVAGRTGVPVGDDDVVVTAGGTGGLAAAVMSVVNPGDEVLVLSPAWPLVAGMVRILGATATHVPFYDRVTDAEAARAVLEGAVSDRTVAIYVNTPNNPSGRRASRAVLEAIAAFAQRRDLWLFADEVYEDFNYAGDHTYLRSLAPERTLSVWSMSKGFGMAGYRCGYVVGPPAWSAATAKIATYTYYCAPRPSQRAALAALGPAGDAWVVAARRAYQELGNEAADRLGVSRPEGSTFLFVDVAEHLDDRGLNGLLQDCVEEGLLVAPGATFGPYPNHVRVCFTSAAPRLVRAGIDVLARRMGR